MSLLYLLQGKNQAEVRGPEGKLASTHYFLHPYPPLPFYLFQYFQVAFFKNCIIFNMIKTYFTISTLALLPEAVLIIHIC